MTLEPPTEDERVFFLTSAMAMIWAAVPMQLIDKAETEGLTHAARSDIAYSGTGRLVHKSHPNPYSGEDEDGD